MECGIEDVEETKEWRRMGPDEADSTIIRCGDPRLRCSEALYAERAVDVRVVRD